VKKNKQMLASMVLTSLGLDTAYADYQLNLMQGVTKLSHELYDLHMLILWICVFIGIAVFGTMFYSIYHHRKSKGHQAEQFHENTTVEIVWTIIPTLILIGMAIPATKTMLDLDTVKDSDMTIKVTGKQWYWEYEYLDSGVRFESHLDEASEIVHRINGRLDENTILAKLTKARLPRDVGHYLSDVDKPIHVPIHKKIRFLFTASDVIHSWWVPDLGWKKDANPGFINEAWVSVDTPGIYSGKCTELCGRDHGFMPIVVVAEEQDKYDAWVKATLDAQNQAPDLSDQPTSILVSKGAHVYLKNCVACHQIDGKGVSGWYPALRGSEKVTGSIDQLIGFIQAGTSKMPSFRKLPDNDLAALITYIRNAPELGNNVGDEIQPNKITPKYDDDE
jgi:cytochrome c oxidase subunit II